MTPSYSRWWQMTAMLLYTYLMVVASSTTIPVTAAACESDQSLTNGSPCVAKCLEHSATRLLPCLTSTATTNNTRSWDCSCLCASEPVWDAFKTCLQSSCSVQEVLGRLSFRATLCGIPVRDVGGGIRAVVVGLTALTTALVGMRLWVSLFLLHRRLDAGDWCTVVSWAFEGGMAVSTWSLRGLGLGRDVWGITREQLAGQAVWYVVHPIMFALAVGFAKMGIVHFYGTIFPERRRAVQITMAFNAAHLLACFCVATFQCSPISFAWLQWDSTHAAAMLKEGARCIDFYTIYTWLHITTTVPLDIWIFLLPLLQLRALRMRWRRKLAVALMFALGMLDAVASVQRVLVSCRLDMANISMDAYLLMYWCLLEASLGIICVCLPSLRLLLLHVIPANLKDNVKKRLSRTAVSKPVATMLRTIGQLPLRKRRIVVPGESCLAETEVAADDTTTHSGGEENDKVMASEGDSERMASWAAAPGDKEKREDRSLAHDDNSPRGASFYGSNRGTTDEPLFTSSLDRIGAPRPPERWSNPQKKPGSS